MNVSVIIPCLNEAKIIQSTLTSVLTQKPFEVIVADGGSEDGTALMAEAQARVILAERGRAQQMNSGARVARGEVLLFLHADTRLPSDGIEWIQKAIEGGASAGRFRMRFDSEDRALRFFAFTTRYSCFSYGDQGFFIRRELFFQMGGFSTEVPFEDVDFYRRLSRVVRPVILKKEVITSARRFLTVGKYRQKWINILLILMQLLGLNVFPAKNKLYPDIR